MFTLKSCPESLWGNGHDLQPLGMLMATEVPLLTVPSLGQSVSNDWPVETRYKEPDPPFFSGMFQRSFSCVQIFLNTDQIPLKLPYGHVSFHSACCSLLSLLFSFLFSSLLFFFLSLSTHVIYNGMRRQKTHKLAA